MPGINFNSNWPAIWRRKRWFGIEYKMGIRIFEYVPLQGDDYLIKGGTFSRASAATYYAGAEGDNIPRTIRIAPVDELRQEHWTQWRDVSTANPLRKGALLERAAENVATFSEDFSNPVWIKTGVTVAPDTLPHPIDPLEPDSGDSVLEDTSNGLHEISRVFTPAAVGDPIAASVFVEPIGAGQKVQVVIEDRGNPANSLRIIFDEVDQGFTENHSGTALPGGVFTDRNIGGWTRICVGGRIPGAAAYTVRFGILDLDENESYIGVPGTGTGLWGAHVELGQNYVTSYIRALAATPGTRAADFLSFGWPLTNRAIPMSVLNRFQDLGTHTEVDAIYDHLGDSVAATVPYLQRVSQGITVPATGEGVVKVGHENSQGLNEQVSSQLIRTQYMVDSMTRLYESGQINFEQTVEGGDRQTYAVPGTDIGLEDWAGTPGVLWVNGVDGVGVGAMVLFQIRMVDNPNSTFIASQRPTLLQTGLKINPKDKKYVHAEDQADDVFFTEVDPDVVSGYAGLVDVDTNAELIQEELGFWFLDDGI